MSNTNLNLLKNGLINRKNLINVIKLKYTEILELEDRFIVNKNESFKEHFTPAFSDINGSIIVKISLIQEHIKHFENSKYEALKNSDSIFEEDIRKKIAEIDKQLNYLTGRVDKIILNLSTFTESENLSILELKTLENIYPIKREILKLLNNISESFEFIKNGMIDAEIFELEYIKRFNQESILIKKSFENNIYELTNEYENKFKSFELRYEKISKSNELLNNGVDAGLKSLNQLNERTQKIELDFTSIIKKAEERAEFDLGLATSDLEQKIETAISEAHVKSEEIEVLHSNFKSMVEKAGIYDLTNNYKVKAEKEEEEYKKFRKFTAWSIIAAIVSTLLIFIFAFFEPHFTNNNNQTNLLLLVSRLSISIMFFVLAFYLSKQASKHYECFQENHRTFLQLAALEPFMANMTPEEKQEIRKGLIPSYFNQGTDGKFAAKGDEVDLPSNINSIVNRVFDLVGEKKEPKTAENTATETKTSV